MTRLKHHLLLVTHHRDALGKNSEALYQKILQWLRDTFEPGDYRASPYVVHSLTHNFKEYLIDFSEERHYALFAMCWQSQIDDYYKSYEVKV